MTSRQLIFLATLGSLLLLAGAFAFQHIGGLAPCKLCLWQRWPHAGAIAIGGIALPTGLTFLAIFGGLAALTTAGIGIYHTGVERKWWEGPSSCSGGGADLGSMSGDDLLNFNVTDTLVMCDEVAWEMLGLSMASWNAVAAILFALLWFKAFALR